MKKLKIYLFLIIISLMVLPLESIAQGPVDPNDNVPIDGGLSILLAAGAAYGVKKYRDHKKKHSEESGPDPK